MLGVAVDGVDLVFIALAAVGFSKVRRPFRLATWPCGLMLLVISYASLRCDSDFACDRIKLTLL